MILCFDKPLLISLHCFEVFASKADQFLTSLYCFDDKLKSNCRTEKTHSLCTLINDGHRCKQ